MAATVTVAASETAGIATSQTTAVASTVDALAGQVATALEIQNSLQNFRLGIFRFDLQTFFYKSSWSSLSFRHICDTPTPVQSLLRPRLAEQLGTPVAGGFLCLYHSYQQQQQRYKIVICPRKWASSESSMG